MRIQRWTVVGGLLALVSLGGLAGPGSPARSVLGVRAAGPPALLSATPMGTPFPSSTPSITPNPSFSATPTVTPSDTPWVIASFTPIPPTATPTIPPTPIPPPPSCHPGWWVTPRQGIEALNSVFVTPGGDAWAAGDDGISHWNGSQWALVGPTGGYSDLEVVGPNEAWGINGNTIGHWTGAAWAAAPYPTPPATQYDFYALAAWSPTDIWVVGDWRYIDSTYLFLHWDGSTWQRVWLDAAAHPAPAAPSGGGYDDIVLQRVAALGPGEMAAYGTESCYGFSWCHNGPVSATRCLSGACPGGAPAGGEFTDGALVTATDRWEVSGALIDHWNGTAWTSVPHPDVGALAAVAATGPRDAWAAGPGGILHWDGTAWTLSTSSAGASALAAAGPNDAWAARGSDLLHYLDFPLFQDVPPGNTFYPYVDALACRGIIGGYPCGGPGEPCSPPGNRPYYRAGNPVTRGQTAKIVASSAQFSETPTAQTFADVPPGSTFYLWVERMASRGIIAGYPCGGAGEPCVGPANRPYFRPNLDVTRGQIAKIVSNSAGWSETPTAQTFADVAPGSTFYLWVERAASRGIIGGYPCGGAGEPCVPPDNRPYFRPGNGATRGQTAKIVQQAFFP